jgi:hypothetical protein
MSLCSKMTLKIHFLSQPRSVKTFFRSVKTEINFKSIDDNFKIAAFLFLKSFVKNAQKMTFLHIPRQIKKQQS